MSLREQYDELYRKDAHPFGAEADALAVRISEYKHSGRALDVGAGDGRNSMFLASKGFEVDALDISEAGLDTLRGAAKERGLRVTTLLGDARLISPRYLYDAILMMFMLHHLREGEAHALIERMKRQTTPGGLHAVSCFTKEGDFYRAAPNTDYFYPARGGIKSLYAGWELLVWEEKNTDARVRKPDGNPMVNMTSFLIARKLAAGG